MMILGRAVIFGAVAFSIVFCLFLLPTTNNFRQLHTRYPDDRKQSLVDEQYESERHNPTLSQIAKSVVAGRVKNIDEDYARVSNETLGFEKVYMVSLPERSDKRDAFSLQARLSNITFTIVDGVDGAKVSAKALPYTMDLRPGQVGCWRAELNIIQEMVANNIQSALIFEDDADWDVGLRAQLTEFAKGARWLGTSEAEGLSSPHSPYGDEWDLLWLGHCSSRPRRNDDRRWVIPNDPTVLPPSARREFEKPRMSRWESGANADNQTRLVFVPEWGSCTAAYALSLRGAQKMLYRQSLMPFNRPIDDGMGDMCGNGVAEGLPFNCVSPFPTIVGVSRPAGGANRASDIGYGSESDTVDVSSHSDRLMFPVRQNIDRLLRQETVFASQYPDTTGEFMGIAEITRAKGHGEHVDLEQEAEEERREKEEEEARRKQEEEEELRRNQELEDAWARKQEEDAWKNRQEKEEAWRNQQEEVEVNSQEEDLKKKENELEETQEEEDERQEDSDTYRSDR